MGILLWLLSGDGLRFRRSSSTFRDRFDRRRVVVVTVFVFSFSCFRLGCTAATLRRRSSRDGFDWRSRFVVGLSLWWVDIHIVFLCGFCFRFTLPLAFALDAPALPCHFFHSTVRLSIASIILRARLLIFNRTTPAFEGGTRKGGSNAMAVKLQA